MMRLEMIQPVNVDVRDASKVVCVCVLIVFEWNESNDDDSKRNASTEVHD